MSIYERAIRPLLFRLDPERVHDAAILAGRALGSNPVTRGALSLLYRRERPILAQRIAGVGFRNPVGLAAGFDKNARLTRVLPSLGFGFAEVGSVTARAYGGNPRPRLVRLPEDRAIIVNYGLKSDGAIAVRKRLRGRHAIPIGVNVAATNTRFASDDDGRQFIDGIAIPLHHVVERFNTGVQFLDEPNVRALYHSISSSRGRNSSGSGAPARTPSPIARIASHHEAHISASGS